MKEKTPRAFNISSFEKQSKDTETESGTKLDLKHFSILPIMNMNWVRRFIVFQ